MLTKLLRWLCNKETKLEPNKPLPTPTVYHRSEHTLSRREISRYALKVLYRLHEAHHQAYLVGGGVRDVLLGLHPKDFDVATDARPEEISALFRNSRIIGRRFRLVHVHFGGNIVEVATFRAEHPAEELDPNLARSREDGMIVRDNIYGSFEEDVWRRDFTVNALYYNIADYSVIDFVGGMADLKNHCLRIIGEPSARYREDPVRMLRAVRFAAKLGFTLHEDTEKPIYTLGSLLANVPGARLFDEYIKLFLSGYALISFRLLRKYKLFSVLFPKTDQCLEDELAGKTLYIKNGARNPGGEINDSGPIETLLTNAFENTDERILAEKPVNPAFLLAAILWYPLCEQIRTLREEQNLSEFSSFFQAFEEILQSQRDTFPIPRRLTQIIRDIWTLQIRLKRRKGHRAVELFSHPRFRAAYDFLLLRVQSGEEEAEELANWWTVYIESGSEERAAMANAVRTPGSRKKRRHKRK